MVLWRLLPSMRKPAPHPHPRSLQAAQRPSFPGSHRLTPRLPGRPARPAGAPNATPKQGQTPPSLHTCLGKAPRGPYPHTHHDLRGLHPGRKHICQEVGAGTSGPSSKAHPSPGAATFRSRTRCVALDTGVGTRARVPSRPVLKPPGTPAALPGDGPRRTVPQGGSPPDHTAREGASPGLTQEAVRLSPGQAASTRKAFPVTQQLSGRKS